MKVVLGYDHVERLSRLEEPDDLFLLLLLVFLLIYRLRRCTRWMINNGTAVRGFFTAPATCVHTDLSGCLRGVFTFSLRPWEFSPVSSHISYTADRLIRRCKIPLVQVRGTRIRGSWWICEKLRYWEDNWGNRGNRNARRAGIFNWFNVMGNRS